MRIGILVFETVEELDVVGPWEVFGMAAQIRTDWPEGEAPEPLLIAAGDSLAPVRCAKGMRLVPDFTTADHPPLDVILVPGGFGVRALLERPDILDWIARTASGCRWVASVCTGSWLMLASGVAAGKRITSHWVGLDRLREMGTAGAVVDGPRFVRDGTLVTSAGVSAGIDMALWLVGQWYGVDHARKTQRWMQYDPAPPYTADL
ncbi:MAG: hypothetical protein RLY86_3795 [Pseudomonadota bacterium]|jgi:transcriptional regulator GlxA family with amidase domain